MKKASKNFKNELFHQNVLWRFGHISSIFTELSGSNLQSTFRYNNSKGYQISLYVSEKTVNIEQPWVLTSPETVKTHENLTTTTTCIQIDVYSTCIHTYIHTHVSPVALYTLVELQDELTHI